jgi:hypothetical protein
LVGRGTVYHWVWALCWLAGAVVLAIMVRWWREPIFERVARVRRRSSLQSWVLAHRRGWRSFFAAMLGAAQLFVLGARKMLAHRLATFTLARRAHAYLFERELERMASERGTSADRPLSTPALASLHPARRGSVWLSSPAEAALQSLEARMAREGGGVVAVVGLRGSGKSTLLARFAEAKAARGLSCRDVPWASLLEMTDLPRDGDAQQHTLLLLDDAEALIRPVVGGLERFDTLLARARSRCRGVLWVFSIDAIVWPFLCRACDARPPFDDALMLGPWTDRQIGSLLAERSSEAGIVPDFRDLLDELPPDADELERQEALADKRAGYYEMVWSYAYGNPAMALEVWRSSLVEDAAGHVRVRPLHAPRAEGLEALPDTLLFVLRAVLQMAPASVADVVAATRISEPQVQEAFGVGRAQGYLLDEGGRVSVCWGWLRAVLLLLERRHLVVLSWP